MTKSPSSKQASNFSKPRFWLLLVLIAITILGAQWGISNWMGEGKSARPDGFPYRLNEPDLRLGLSSELAEISGLAIHPDGRLLAVQDEKGYVYSLDLVSGEVIDKYKFEKSGDYEGIAVNGKHTFVLRSDGDVYRIKNLGKDNQKTKKLENALETRNDAEGLEFDADGKLLIACKGDSRIDGNKKDHRAVYAFDLQTNVLSEKPFLDIKLEKLKSLTRDDKTNFRPSALARHPITGDYYILATVGKLLVVLSPDGEPYRAIDLRGGDFLQPEGIAFLANGDLLISNEAHVKGGRATLLRFTYQP